jgi:hypothetical protein
MRSNFPIDSQHASPTPVSPDRWSPEVPEQTATRNDVTVHHTTRNIPTSILEAGVLYKRDLSWRVTPVTYRGKRPRLQEWEKQDLTVEDIRQIFADGPSNIGVLLGPSGLGDVDKDCDEVRALSPYFLPSTPCEFGRASAPGSHSIYAAPADSSFEHIQFVDPVRSKSKSTRKDAMLVELRAGDHQTVFPPSTHESGEPIQWTEFGTPAVVQPDDLKRDVSLLAAGSLLARYWPDGARHEAALAIGGALLQSGLPLDEVRHFVSAVATVAGDEEVSDRVRAVDDTAHELQEGKAVTGWGRLADLMGKEVMQTVRKWLGVKAAGKSGEQRRRLSQASALATLALETNTVLWHTPDGHGYITLAINGHLETWRLGTSAVRQWLSHMYFKTYGRVPSSQAMQDALDRLAGQARFEGEEHQVYVRVAPGPGQRIYLDLANALWEVVEITPEGWRVVGSHECPVKFRRPRGMLPLPTPLLGGSVAELRPFVNVASDRDWALLVTFLMSVIRPQALTLSWLSPASKGPQRLPWGASCASSPIPTAQPYARTPVIRTT